LYTLPQRDYVTALLKIPNGITSLRCASFAKIPNGITSLRFALFRDPCLGVLQKKIKPGCRRQLKTKNKKPLERARTVFIFLLYPVGVWLDFLLR
jgi:hypothetical protein